MMGEPTKIGSLCTNGLTLCQLQSSENSLWFGRDVFGRRSLLWHLPVDGSTDSFLLSSVGQYHPDKMPLVWDKYSNVLSVRECHFISAQGYWEEVPASCIFQLKCSNDQNVGGMAVGHITITICVRGIFMSLFLCTTYSQYW